MTFAALLRTESHRVRLACNGTAETATRNAYETTRTIVIAILLGIVGAALPIAGALYISWTLAVSAEEERLIAFANRAITRANSSLNEIGEVFQTISTAEFAPCSAAHIGEMRRLVFNTPSVAKSAFSKTAF